jgi:methyl-accepting chemotaxis protein
MLEGRKRSESTVIETNKENDFLEKIEESVISIDDMATHIASAPGEQTAVADEINRNISNISHVTEQSAQSSLQISQSSEDIANLASDIQVLINRFKV